MSDNHPDPRLAGVPFSGLVAELHRRGWTDEQIAAEIANELDMTLAEVRRLLLHLVPSPSA